MEINGREVPDNCPRCGAPPGRDVLVGVAGKGWGHSYSCGTIYNGASVTSIDAACNHVRALRAQLAERDTERDNLSRLLAERERESMVRTGEYATVIGDLQGRIAALEGALAKVVAEADECARLGCFPTLNPVHLADARALLAAGEKEG